MSQITTHVLDTSMGKPGAGIEVSLLRHLPGDWDIIAKGVTNTDGRITDLLSKDIVLPTGIYKITFDTGAYFTKLGVKAFYPFVEIVFDATTTEHYHVPLLLNPFGFSTYRGS